MTDAWIDAGEPSAPQKSKMFAGESSIASAMGEAFSHMSSGAAESSTSQPEEIQRRINEMLGFLQDLSDTQRMQHNLRKDSGMDSDDNGEDSWSSSLFSDN